VADAVPEDAAQVGRRFHLDDGWFDGNSISLILHGEFVGLGVEVSPDFVLEEIQVLFCPDYFEVSSV
jgi:hypothetical protein